MCTPWAALQSSLTRRHVASQVFNWAQRTTALPDMVVDALAEVAVSGPLLWFLDDADAARFVLTTSHPRGHRSASGSSSARALARAVGKLKRELLHGGARVGMVTLEPQRGALWSCCAVQTTPSACPASLAIAWCCGRAIPYLAHNCCRRRPR